MLPARLKPCVKFSFIPDNETRGQLDSRWELAVALELVLGCPAQARFCKHRGATQIACRLHVVFPVMDERHLLLTHASPKSSAQFRRNRYARLAAVGRRFLPAYLPPERRMCSTAFRICVGLFPSTSMHRSAYSATLAGERSGFLSANWRSS